MDLPYHNHNPNVRIPQSSPLFDAKRIDFAGF